MILMNIFLERVGSIKPEFLQVWRSLQFLSAASSKYFLNLSLQVAKGMPTSIFFERGGLVVPELATRLRRNFLRSTGQAAPPSR